jgi:hypothetical protein
VCVAPSHTGVAPAQSAFAMQATHWPAGALQRGVAPVQAVMFVAEQTPQAPDGWQAEVAPEHSLSITHPRQTRVVPSHTGSTPAQVALVRQPTQTPRGTSHIAVAPRQVVVFVAEQAPQAPDGWQAGVAGVPAQSASPVQAWHVFVPVSQTGFVAPHCAAVVQETHVPVVASHPATGPLHFVAFDAEQTPQAPDGWQAGVAGVAAQSASAAQPWHVCVEPSHTGVAPEHCALVRQPTQVPAPTSHTDVAPVQRRAFDAEQTPQAPDGWQAGVAGVAAQSASVAQAWQVCVAASQVGVVPEQPVVPRQATHVAVPTSHTGVPPAHLALFVAEHAPQDPFGWQAGAAAPHWASVAHG